MADHKVVRKGNTIKVKARKGSGYCDNVDLLCKIKDTGNGIIAKFPSYASLRQDNYICLDYDEAYLLFEGLKPLVKEWDEGYKSE